MKIKGLGRDADQSPAYSTENESQWLYTPIPLPACLYGICRDDFTSTSRG